MATASQNLHQDISVGSITYRGRKSFYVTFNGRIPGDSPGYDLDEAIAVAKETVASDPEFRTWVAPSDDILLGAEPTTGESVGKPRLILRGLSCLADSLRDDVWATRDSGTPWP